MQVPVVPGPGVELQDAMQRLDISRDPRRSQQPPAPPQPQPQPQTRPPQQPAQSSRESSRATSDHRHHHNEGGQANSSQSAAQLESALKASHEQVWYLKSIDFVSPSGASRKYNIILQNYNGPCSFIAICNILILREQIEILPPGRKTVSYDFLAQLVGEHILLTAPDVDVSAALSMMPLTTRGMDLNPVFTSATAFRPATTGGELALFSSAGITLVHGWVIDPEGPEYTAVKRVGDYDSAMNLIVEADVLTSGLLVSSGNTEDGDGAGPSQAGPSNSNINLTEEERKKVEDALMVRTFLDNTRSQLTYHGLFTLSSLPSRSTGLSQPTTASGSPPSSSDPSPAGEPAVPPPHTELFALFRNSHLAVLYRRGGTLYTLVTDQVFLHEPTVVWELLGDIDQGGAEFVDSAFERAVPVGGDFAGWNPPSESLGTVDPVDHALAMELQNAEDEWARREYARRQQEREMQRRREQAEYEQRRWERREEEKRKEKHQKKDKDCVIM